MPALQRCLITFYMKAACDSAVLHLDEDSFHSQRSSLTELTLCGAGRDIHVMSLGHYLVELPALRSLTIQHLRVSNLQWLEPSWQSEPPGPLQTLDLDDNADLQLDEVAAAAVLNMAALRKLSMRKTDPSDVTGVAHQAGPAPCGPVWSAESVRGIARIMAARPALQLCF